MMRRMVKQLVLVASILATLVVSLPLPSVVAREVCMTCYADSGDCTIPEGYNVNCIYVSIIAGKNKTCWPNAPDVYGGFDLQTFALEHNLTVYGMGNYGYNQEKGKLDYPVELEACRDLIQSGVGTSGWPPLGDYLNIDWEPCTGDPQWTSADAPFRLDIGGSVQCTDNLPSWGEEMEMVYDGAQLKYQSGKSTFDCDKRYMFATQASKINGPQTGSEGGLTPAMFITQCGEDADYDLYVAGQQYSDPAQTATCSQDGDVCSNISGAVGSFAFSMFTTLLLLLVVVV